MFLACPSQLEGVGDDAVAGSARKDILLDRHLELGVSVEPSADLRVLSFTVFPNDDKVDVPRLPAAERTGDPFQQPRPGKSRQTDAAARDHLPASCGRSSGMSHNSSRSAAMRKTNQTGERPLLERECPLERPRVQCHPPRSLLSCSSSIFLAFTKLAANRI